MGFFVVLITKFVMFIMTIARIFKGKDDDVSETEIMKIVEDTITGIFG